MKKDCCKAYAFRQSFLSASATCFQKKLIYAFFALKCAFFYKLLQLEKIWCKVSLYFFRGFTYKQRQGQTYNLMLSYIGGSAAKQKRDECGSSLFFYILYSCPKTARQSMLKSTKPGCRIQMQKAFSLPRSCTFRIVRGKKTLKRVNNSTAT